MEGQMTFRTATLHPEETSSTAEDSDSEDPLLPSEKSQSDNAPPFSHPDKGKRRTHRYESLESSDSGVATLSPDTSDSPELISPYSPSDFCSEPDANSSSPTGSPVSSSPSPPASYVGGSFVKDLEETLDIMIPASPCPLKPAQKNEMVDVQSSRRIFSLVEALTKNGKLGLEEIELKPEFQPFVPLKPLAQSLLPKAFLSLQEKQRGTAGWAKVQVKAEEPPRKKFRLEEDRKKKTESEEIKGPAAIANQEFHFRKDTSFASSAINPGGPASALSSLCLWKDCTHDHLLNILEHIQTLHVAPQTKSEGYFCKWEGCKVYNKKSCSLSWLERHVLSHGGNKPFLCIIPGCGQSFGSQGTLERHVNSHITTTETLHGLNGHSIANRKLDSTPLKSSRRKKKAPRKKTVNVGQYVDFFDKRTMEVIKYNLACTKGNQEVNQRELTFTNEILARRIEVDKEPRVLVRWYPEFIFPDEYVEETKYKGSKIVPIRQIPSEKLRILFPKHLPPQRRRSARKWKSKYDNLKLEGDEIEEENGCGCDCGAEISDGIPIDPECISELMKRFDS